MVQESAATSCARPDARQPLHGGLTLLDWTHLLIIAACVQMTCIRLVRITAALQAQAAISPATEPRPER
jgi:hypothetical protein